MELGIGGLVAVVTGAGGGIGAATAHALAAEGARVALMDRDAAALAVVAESLRRAGVAASVHVVDVCDEAAVVSAVAGVLAVHGGIDLVIATAGVSGPVGLPLRETPAVAWDDVFAVNVRGAFLVLREAVPALRCSAAASVVLVASDSAVVAAPGMVPYGASKAALVQLARASAVDLAPDGIRVNAFCPSIVDTAMSREDLGVEVGGFVHAPFPVQTPDEVAAQLVFLVSPRARPVNGTSLLSDFGHAARSSFPA